MLLKYAILVLIFSLSPFAMQDTEFEPQLRLNTRLIDSENNVVCYKLKDLALGETQRKVVVLVRNLEVGAMRYSYQEDHLYIHRMDNFSKKTNYPLKHAGSLLFEYAFRKSEEVGLGGHVELNAIENAGAAYYLMGMRKKSKEINSQELVELIQDKKELSATDCLRYGIIGSMFLPEAMIEEKRREINRFIPIGSNLFHSNHELKYPRLIQLVNEGKLDKSNAVEIEAKMPENDERLSYLLSNVGLEMMKRNYLSAWYIGVYFFHIEALEKIISSKGLKAFESGRIQNIFSLHYLSLNQLSVLID